MKAAGSPRSVRELRVLVVDAVTGARETRPASALPGLLEPGDLVVVNDAATLPASLAARVPSGASVELRLVGGTDFEGSAVHFTAALLGSGDHRTRTEDRPAPAPVFVGDVLEIGDELVAHVLAISVLSDLLVHVELGLREPMADKSAIWAALYRAGKPVQYAHVPAPLALWDVQNVWAARPWAVEMPSAGRVLDAKALLALRARGIELASVTHAAGLSATGHPEIDELLPLPERFEVPESAARAVQRAKARGGRVLAVGTSVVRALESAARLSGGGPLRAASGVTDYRLGPATRRQVVDGILTGVHESDTTHFALLGAFADRQTLEGTLAAAEHEGLLGHEFGDAWLVWGERASLGARSTDVATPVVAQREHAAVRASASCASSATVAA
jgi:S-adenosylmethionine:tRNA ribosyltransferase-isomerase